MVEADIATAVRIGSQRFLAAMQRIYDVEADKFELYFLHNIATVRVASGRTARLDGAPGEGDAVPDEAEADLDEEIDALYGRLAEAERRRRAAEEGRPPSSAVLAEIRAARPEILTPAWHERWAAELDGLHDKCWDLMGKLGEQRDLEDAS